MRCLLLLLVGVFAHIPVFLVGELINRSVVNIYLQPEENTEVDSQAIYGNAVEVIGRMNDWSKIRAVDGVDGGCRLRNLWRMQTMQKILFNFFENTFINCKSELSSRKMNMIKLS